MFIFGSTAESKEKTKLKDGPAIKTNTIAGRIHQINSNFLYSDKSEINKNSLLS
jgi:hypothetical protein